MPEIVEFTLADGAKVAVSPARPRGGSTPIGLGERMEVAEKTLRQAIAPVTAAAAEMLEDFRRLAHPDEVEISFGVALDGKLGGIIVGASAGAHLEVKLRWRPVKAED
ncbi:CU044_2847 family protein [Actinospica robiniae]|uniref:CU044_2847 family protein n=1 Tax=Actinospica robiniae TaxID=304901 RepID=UPI0003F92397|nr:CU044_2847 family protein [Actinospica robiniae]